MVNKIIIGIIVALILIIVAIVLVAQPVEEPEEAIVKSEFAEITEQAIEEKNPGKCEELSTTTSKEDCIAVVAMETKNIGTCDLIEDELVKEYCRNGLAE